MRFDRIPVTLPSLALTTLAAAAAGICSVVFQPRAEPEAAVAEAPHAAHVVDEATSAMSEAASRLAVEVRPAGETDSGDLVLEATLINRGSTPVEISEDGSFDLVVQHVASPLPMRVGDVTFLTLFEVAATAPVRLLPGEALVRMIDLSCCAPFDAPGQYRVGGRWQGAAATGVVRPFDLTVEGTCTAALLPAARREG